MRKFDLTVSEFAFVVATRAALGAGIGLLLSKKIPRRRLRAVGLSLLALGALTTVPAVRFIHRSAHDGGTWKAA